MSHPSLAQLDHRPWPLPPGEWTWQQSWFDLAFLHWPLEPEAIEPLLPRGIELDLFDRQAWIGVVPFTMTLQRRGLPRLPGVGWFPEINVRTYVRHQGKPGVWFFSLDAASRLAVWGGRQFFHLPYYHAAMEVASAGEGVDYISRRVGSSEASFAARYQPTGPPAPAVPGTLEHWLTERYCLFSYSQRGEFWCGEIHHLPWPLQPATAEIRENTMLAPLGLPQPTIPPLTHFSRRIDVVLWPLERAS